MSAENTNKQSEIDQALELMNGEVKEAQHPDGKEMTEWVFTNDKTNPHIRQLFHLLMNSAFANKFGLMHAKLKDEDIVHTIIVGVEETPDGVATWPIAKILTEDEQGIYLAPNGDGSWIE